MEKRSENKDMNVKGHNDSHGGKNKNKIIFIYLLGREILYGRKKIVYAKTRIHTNRFTSGGFFDGGGTGAWTPEALDEATNSPESTSRADKSSTFAWKAEIRVWNKALKRCSFIFCGIL